MQCRGVQKVAHYIIAHFLNKTGDEMRGRRGVLGLPNFHASGAEIARVWREAVKRHPMQIKNDRRADAKGPSASDNILYQIEHPIELSDRVFRLAAGYLVGIGEQRGIFGLAVSVIAQSRYARRILSAASSTICRVTRSFSICAFP